VVSNDGGVLAAVISFDDFVEELASFFGREPSELTAEARLVEDLALDSFDLLELDALLGDVSGGPVPPRLWATINTVGDVHHWYVTYRSQDAATKVTSS